MTINAIPTVGPRGVEFRSRLEARWAWMFELLEWPWEYEPSDLAAYIPDFILVFPAAPLLVEVKPALYLAEMRQAIPKIANSGWNKEALIVGARLYESAFWGNITCAGLLREATPVDEDEDYIGDDDDHGWWWDEGALFRCAECKSPSILHSGSHWRCRVNGCYDGDHHIRPECFDHLWVKAGNRVQWKRGRRVAF